MSIKIEDEPPFCARSLGSGNGKQLNNGDINWLGKLLPNVKGVYFNFFKVTDNFNPTSCFSRVDLNMTTFQSQGINLGIYQNYNHCGS